MSRVVRNGGLLDTIEPAERSTSDEKTLCAAAHASEHNQICPRLPPIRATYQPRARLDSSQPPLTASIVILV